LLSGDALFCFFAFISVVILVFRLLCTIPIDIFHASI
jgi:hypothetical protein